MYTYIHLQAITYVILFSIHSFITIDHNLSVNHIKMSLAGFIHVTKYTATKVVKHRLQLYIY